MFIISSDIRCQTNLLYKTMSGNQMCSDGTCKVSTPP